MTTAMAAPSTTRRAQASTNNSIITVSKHNANNAYNNDSNYSSGNASNSNGNNIESRSRGLFPPPLIA